MNHTVCSAALECPAETRTNPLGREQLWDPSAQLEASIPELSEWPRLLCSPYLPTLAPRGSRGPGIRPGGGQGSGARSERSRRLEVGGHRGPSLSSAWEHGMSPCNNRCSPRAEAPALCRVSTLHLRMSEPAGARAHPCALQSPDNVGEPGSAGAPRLPAGQERVAQWNPLPFSVWGSLRSEQGLQQRRAQPGLELGRCWASGLCSSALKF